MSYNILGINPGHNGSAALVIDGELVYFIEEERLSRMKYDGNPFRGILDILSRWRVDEVIIGGTTLTLPTLPWTMEDPYTALVRKFNPKVVSSKIGDEHHLSHAATGFYNSGFNKALAIIVDGAGSYKKEQLDNNGEYFAEGFETESVWICEYPNKFALVQKVYGSNKSPKISTGLFDFDDAATITKTYEAVSYYLGFGFIEAGKTMGLAPYGKRDKLIPNLFYSRRGSKDIFIPNYPGGAIIDQARNTQFIRPSEPAMWHAWHTDPTMLTDIEKNLAWQIQHDTQILVGNMVEAAVNATGITDIIIAGGYGLNCVTNYYLAKRFPQVKFYFEPIANDGGTAIGIAKFAWHSREQDITIRPQKTLYHGPEYTLTKDNIVREGFETKTVSYSDVAQLIANKNIVALFQGRSEAGPRALGNRSILYDPRDIDGKDFVNTVKGREWFRPFAGTVLKEDAQDWFDLAGYDESPHMMMAVNVVADKVNQIPAITHVDDTCRIQTVTESQNKHYYKLIQAFNDITNVPVLFNTSFNLAGEPLVETIDDAYDTLLNSKLKYLYLPELQLMVTKID